MQLQIENQLRDLYKVINHPLETLPYPYIFSAVAKTDKAPVLNLKNINIRKCLTQKKNIRKFIGMLNIKCSSSLIKVKNIKKFHTKAFKLYQTPAYWHRQRKSTPITRFI